MKLNIIIILAILLFGNCSGKTNTTTISLSDTIFPSNDSNYVNIMKDILKGQLKHGVSGLYDRSFDVSTYNFTEKDLDILIPYLDSLLKKNGYITPTKEQFKEKNQKYFGRTISYDIESKFICLYFDSQKKCDIELLFYRNTNSTDLKAPIFYALKEKLFMTSIFSIPEILDYKKMFPEEHKSELDMINYYIDATDSSKILINKWTDISDLSTQQEDNINMIIHRNKYLFNDSQASLTWLLNNDGLFLESLFLVFGYDKEPKINQMVLDDSYKDTERKKENIHYNYSDCEGVLYSRDCNGNLRINHGLLATIKDMTTADDSKYLEMIYNYLKNIEAGTLMTDLSDDEKIEIYCHFGRLEVDLNKKYQKNLKWNRAFAGISSLLVGHNYQEIAQKHKYWGILNFEEIEQVVEYEEPIVNDGEHMSSFDFSTLQNHQ